MNIYQITKKIWYLIPLLLGDLCFAQTLDLKQLNTGLPYIENFSPTQIGHRANNSSICYDSRDFLYLANVNGILEFDGTTWNKINVIGTPVITQTKTGQIIYGAFNNFGILGKSENGINQPIPYADTNSLNCGQIHSIIARKDNIVFTTKNELYQYSYSNGLTRLLAASKLKLLQCKSELLLSTDSATLWFRDETDDTVTICNFPLIQIVGLQNTYIGFGTDSILTFDKQLGITQRIKSPLYNYRILDAIKTNDGYAIATKNQGIVFVNKKFQKYLQLSTKNGLQHDQVNQLLPDKYGNIWAALASGISRIESPSPYSFYNKNNGLEGKVSSIINFKGNTYVSTTSGTYRINSKDNEGAKKIFGPTSLLFSNERVLYAGTDSGIYSNIDSKPQKIFNGNITKAYIPDNQELICFLAIEDEVVACRLVEDKCAIIRNYGKLPDIVQSMAYDTYGNFWIGTRYAGLFRSETDKNGTSLPAKQVATGAGLPEVSEWVEVIPTVKGVLFSTAAGIYRFDQDINRFYKDKLIELPPHSELKRIHPIVEDQDDNLWMGINGENNITKQIAVAWNIPGKKHYTLINQPFAKSNEFVSDIIYPSNNFVVWFGGFDGLMQLDFKKVRSDSINSRCYIRSVVLGKDSLLCQSPEFLININKAPTQLSPKLHSIRFDYVSPYYASKTKVKYQYRLEGLNEKWSPLTSQTYKEYDRLPEGTYTFRVRSQDEQGNISESASFSFVVNQPFYQSKTAILIYIIAVVFILILFRKWRTYLFAKEKQRLEIVISARTEDLLLEKEKTERLLSNILPERTVKELKDKGRAQSMRFDMVTVLFSDIQGFTKIAEQMNPDNLVDELDRFFLQFDGIVDQFNIEKIKTIGDAYMCAGGLPEKNRSNPLEVIIAALEIQHYISQMQELATEKGKEYWGLRIGIHTGPVVAGVIGSKKFTYDIWGDTVNIASRMESSGMVGRVNISEDTYLLVNEYFDCEYRGRMPVKYKGEIDMYFVNGFKPHLTDDPFKIKPNKSFLDKLALIRYEDLEDFIFDKMEKELPLNYYYHNIRHTIDVIVSVEILGRGEGITDEELLLLKIASLFHDAGFIIDYHDHEQLGIQLANDFLPKFGYSQELIRKIGDLIYATKLPAEPKSKLEEIMCDADLDYLGRSDYLPVSRDLYNELLEMGIMRKNEYEWNKLQIKFLQSHTYFTDTAKALRNNNKNRQLKKLLEENYAFENEAKMANQSK